MPVPNCITSTTPAAAGWGTQVPDELMLNLDGEFRRRFDLAPGSRDLIARGMLEVSAAGVQQLG